MPLTSNGLAANHPKQAVQAEQPPPSDLNSATNAIAVNTNTYPRQVQNVFEMQVALARLAISPGSIDGQLGAQTRSALRAFQKKELLPITGELDHATREKLVLTQPPIAAYLISSNDLARLQPLSPTWLGKSLQSALDYETILELVAEKAKSSPNLLRKLNPEVDWSAVQTCRTVEIPNVGYPSVNSHAVLISITLSEKILEAWDEGTNLLAHFPCSIARHVEKRPVGELRIASIAPNPNYTFDPALFPESAEAKELKTKLVLPSGPNNPVGLAWIGLDKPGYGIHGTPNPEQVGRTESHGCFRLANWNADYLLRLVEIGVPVHVQP
jgi:lipoprotein-anchoring transpeptidase ErfK/SrfK